MKKKTLIYASIMSALGLAVGVGACVYFFARWGAENNLIRFLLLSLMYILCRSLPLYVRQDCTIDMSFISVLAITLVEGPLTAVVICLVTSPFIVVPSDDGKSRAHIFNTPLIKTTFNTANLILTLSASGVAFYAVGGIPGDIALPGALLPMGAYILVAILVNSLIMITLFSLEMSMPFYPNILGMFTQLLPSMICAAPIGYFMAYLMRAPSGIYTAALFMLPLLLARYAFKLFLEGKKQQVAMIETLTGVIEAKDPYTEGHSRRVSEYAAQIAVEMRLRPAQIETLRLAALFHDIGKIGIGDAILCKPGRLTDEEWAVMRQHPRIGMNLLRNTHYYDQVKDIVLHHHETYDGRGYPDGTSGDAVSLSEYIISIADAFDAMTSDRPYRKSLPLEKTRSIILEEMGKQFHPEVAAIAVRMIDEGKLQVLYGRTDEARQEGA